MDSVDPVADSLFIAGFREKMEGIRHAEGRPTVALVLSGGGAKGAAEVGALKFLEEQGIPVDMICGTSIGGLIGGLYSVGYRSADLYDLFTTSDWEYILSDRIDDSYRSYRSKQYSSRVLAQIPLIHLEDESVDIKTAKGVGSLASSLPSGYAFGLNVNNLLSSLLVGYQDDMDFKDLPTPFFCVATDLVTGKEKNWCSGSLFLAMRSTMSIPGLFDPVRTDGMVLVDGGTRNNFPVDIVKAIGPDFIIGIDISGDGRVYDDVTHIGDMAGRFVSMLGNAAFNRNIGAADLLITPSVDEYSMLSFNSEAIDTMLNRGYSAAVEKADEIAALKEWIGKPDVSGPASRAVDARTEGIRIEDITFSGVTPKESRYLLSRLKFKPGDEVHSSDIDDAVSYLVAMETFESVRYKLSGTSNPFRLEFICRKSPVHRFGFGLRADTEEAISLLLNFGFNTHKISGSKFEFTTKLGNTQKAWLRYSLVYPDHPAFNVEARVNNYSMGSFANSSSTQIISAWSHSEKFYFSDWKWSRFDFRLGLSNDFYAVRNILSNSYMIAKEEIRQNYRGDYLSAFATGAFYSLDNHYYPTRGASVDLGYQFEFAQVYGASSALFSPYHIFSADIRKAHSPGERFSIIWDLHLRSIFNSGSSHLGISNFVGGSIKGRYVEQQIPFIGFNNVLLCYDNVAVLNLDFRYNVWKKLYLSLQGGYIDELKTLLDPSTLSLKPSCYAGALEAGYKSLAGPLKAKLQWSNLSGWGAFLSFGYEF